MTPEARARMLTAAMPPQRVAIMSEVYLTGPPLGVCEMFLSSPDRRCASGPASAAPPRPSNLKPKMGRISPLQPPVGVLPQFRLIFRS
jgi:hypothetical protein